MFVIPFAGTSEEQAAAHGLPFTAQLLVEQAKKHYESFRQGAEWRHHWHREARRQRREWRAAWRHERAAMRARRHWYWPSPPPRAGDADYAAQLLAGVLNPLAALGSVVLLIALWGSIVWLAFMVVFFWFAYQHWPDLQHFLRELVDSVRARYGHPSGQAIDWIVGG